MVCGSAGDPINALSADKSFAISAGGIFNHLNLFRFAIGRCWRIDVAEIPAGLQVSRLAGAQYLDNRLFSGFTRLVGSRLRLQEYVHCFGCGLAIS